MTAFVPLSEGLVKALTEARDLYAPGSDLAHFVSVLLNTGLAALAQEVA